MSYTFARVAAHCGLRLSYYITAAFVGMTFLYFVLTEYRTATPTYILFVMLLVPSLTKSFFFSNQSKNKKENALAFPLFCKKYGFDPITYKSLRISYLLIFILFAAWQFSCLSFADSVSACPRYLPSGLAMTSLLIRLLGTLCYRLYFHFFPLRAMR